MAKPTDTFIPSNTNGNFRDDNSGAAKSYKVSITKPTKYPGEETTNGIIWLMDLDAYSNINPTRAKDLAGRNFDIDSTGNTSYPTKGNYYIFCSVFSFPDKNPKDGSELYDPWNEIETRDGVKSIRIDLGSSLQRVKYGELSVNNTVDDIINLALDYIKNTYINIIYARKKSTTWLDALKKYEAQEISDAQLNKVYKDLANLEENKVSFVIDNDVATEPAQQTGPEVIPGVTASNNNATNSTTTTTEPREYTFDVQIKDTFYNSEIGYLTITGKLDNTFVYGDQQDTIDPEYTEDIFAGSEEDQLLLASIEQIYPAEVLAELPPEEVKIIKENAKAAQKLGKPLKSPPNDLIIAMRKYGITSKLERAHFLAQCAHESGNYVYKSELASGKAYEGRRDLGNTNPGDGPKYKGRGFIQVTGRANYEAYSKYLVSKGLDNVLNNPDLVATKYSADAACYWWKFLSRNITNLALKGSSSSVVELVTRRVNGGTNGLNDRQQKFDKLWGEISQDGSRYA